MTRTEESLMALVREMLPMFGRIIRDPVAEQEVMANWNALRLAIREVLAERSAMIDNVRFAREHAEKAETECKRLRKLLRETSGPMSYGHWSTDFRDKVNTAIKDQP